MKAAVFRAPDEFAVHDAPEPAVGPPHVLVEVQVCGLGSGDVLRAMEEADDWQRFGREFGGRVVRIGPEVTRFRPGDSAVWIPARPCGLCRQCLSGQPARCLEPISGEARGCAERVVDHEQMWLPARGLRPIEMALVEPVTAALDLAHAGDIAPGGDVAVIGAGPLGLLAALLAKECGAARVFVVDLAENRARLERAEQLGASATIPADEQDVGEALRSHAPDGVDSVLVTASPGSLPLAVELCAVGGTVAFAGALPDESRYATLDAYELQRRRVAVRAAANHPPLRWPLALDLLRRGIVDAERIYTHVFPLADIGQAFETARDPRSGAIKVAVLVQA